MTLDELARTLPNGFHDAEVSTATLDYARGEARLILDVWIGDMEAPAKERETYRLAELTFVVKIFFAPGNT